MEVTGRVVSAGGGVYRVRLDDGGEVEASLRGRLKRPGAGIRHVVPGDRVRVALRGEGGGTVEDVLPRRSELLRRGGGRRRPKVLAANVDQAVVVVSVREPEVPAEVVDRLLVVGEANGLDTALVVNKVDLVENRRLDAVQKRYTTVGYPVLAVSATSGAGLGAFRERLLGRTSVLLGPSGVGKSSLLNALEPGLGLRVGELSRKAGRGRHTTVRSRILSVEPGADIVDTPGFSDIGLWGVSPEEVGGCFPEIRARRAGCRFRGCLHRAEPECRVKAGVEEGAIDAGRYRSYLRLLEEAESGTT